MVVYAGRGQWGLAAETGKGTSFRMTPREAINRLRATPRSEQASPAPSNHAQEVAGARLAVLLAELKAMPGATPFHTTRTLPRRDPAAAVHFFALTDALAVLAAFFVAWFCAHFSNMLVLGRPFASESVLNEGARFVQFATVAAGVFVWFWHNGHYRSRQPFWMEAQKVVSAFALALVVDGFFHSLIKLDFSRIWMLGTWILAALFVLAARGFARRVMRARGIWAVRTLLIGGGATARETRAALRSAPEMGYDIVMQIENLPLVLQTAGGSWQQLCDRFDADYVIIALDGPDLNDADAAMAQLARENLPFSVSPPMGRLPVLGGTPHYFFNHNVMLMAQANNLAQPLPRILKRTMDIGGALTGILCLSPLLLALACLVRRDGGAVFFRDMRIGRDGRPFACLKFRSMVVNGDAVLNAYLEENPTLRAEWEVFHKLRTCDPRVTKIGAFMRRWSLDELPQLFNVLCGDMSLVGPRPVSIGESEDYRIELLQYCRVRPGLTGLWQVSGRSDVSFDGRVQMDAWYVRNWSLWHDIAILCKTFPAVFLKKGAY